MRIAVACVAVYLAGCSSSNGAGVQPDAGVEAATDARADVVLDGSRDGSSTADASCPAVSSFDPATASEVVVPGDTPAAGIFDPSFVYPADAGSGVMAYSAVPDQQTIRTHLAVSSDHGATWTLAVEANVPEAGTVASTDPMDCPGGTCTGNFISEVPSLVHDEDEPDATKAWKLFTHRYLASPGPRLHYAIGTIAMQTAPAPAGPWTPPQKLIGWNDPSCAYSSTGIVANVSTLSGTGDCLALTEPGALWRPGAIDLAVGCAYLAGTSPALRIVLLRTMDHGATWQAVGTMLGPSDGDCVAGATGINAADLFVSGGVEYLSATPGDSTGAYLGCLVFSVANPTTGAVARDSTGHALPMRTIAPQPAQFSGACTFADGAGGYALDVGFLTPNVQRKFRIFRPGVAGP